MRLLVSAAAALLAVTASAQTPPAPESAEPAAAAVAAPAPAAAPAAAPEAAPAAPAKGAGAGYTLRSGGDSLTIYGLLDLTIGYTDNTNAAGDAIIGFRAPWFSGSRYGLQARHALDDASAIIAKLEGEFVIGTGAQDTAGVMFGRDAWLGYESQAVGQLTFGRQNTMARDFSQNYGDAYGSGGVRMDEGGWTNTNNFKSPLFYTGSATGTRFDNGVVWKRKAGDFVLGAGYQLGGTNVSVKRNSTIQLGLAWNGGRYNLSGFFNQVNQAGFLDRSFSVGGNATPVKQLRLAAGYFHYTGEQPAAAAGDRTDDVVTASAKVMPAEAYDLEVGYVWLKSKNALGTATATPNPFASVVGNTVVGSGDRNTLYASVFYHLDKRSEVYLAGDHLTLTDGYKVSATNGKTSQTELVGGCRFKF